MSFSDQEKINLSLKKALNIIQTSTDTYHGNEVIKEKKYSESKTILKTYKNC